MVQIVFVLAGAYLFIKKRVKISSKKELVGIYAKILGVIYIAIAGGMTFFDPDRIETFYGIMALSILVTLGFIMWAPSQPQPSQEGNPVVQK